MLCSSGEVYNGGQPASRAQERDVYTQRSPDSKESRFFVCTNNANKQSRFLILLRSGAYILGLNFFIFHDLYKRKGNYVDLFSIINKYVLASPAGGVFRTSPKSTTFLLTSETQKKIVRTD